jgi:hypothetical protein
MENDGNESDKNRLFVLDLTTGIKSNISEKWDQSCATLLLGHYRQIYLPDK